MVNAPLPLPLGSYFINIITAYSATPLLSSCSFYLSDLSWLCCQFYFNFPHSWPFIPYFGSCSESGSSSTNGVVSSCSIYSNAPAPPPTSPAPPPNPLPASTPPPALLTLTTVLRVCSPEVVGKSFLDPAQSPFVPPLILIQLLLIPLLLLSLLRQILILTFLSLFVP